MKKASKPLVLFLVGVGSIVFTAVSLVLYLIVKINAITSMGAIGIIGGADTPILMLYVRSFFGECFGLFLLLPIIGLILIIISAVMRFNKSK